MKNTLKALTIGAALVCASAAYAIPSSGSVYIEKTANAATYGGGEFKATVGSEDPFYTFCVEREQPLTSSLPGTFDYMLSNSTSSTSNVLSEGTVYLYRKFLAEPFPAVTRKDLSISLQLAIWTLEGEGAGLGQTTVNNTFLALVDGIFGAGAYSDTTDNTVRVMQIKSGEDDLQDVLVYVPDSGTSLLLLGFGLTVLAVARRRMNSAC